MKKTQVLIPLILLLFFLLFLSLFANVRFLLFSRASSSTLDFSQNNSYLVISPLEAKADGQEKIRLFIYVLNDKGLGVSGKKIVLNKSPELISEEVQNLTDNYGRAIFDLSSNSQGEYFVEATINSARLGEGIKVKFN